MTVKKSQYGVKELEEEYGVLTFAEWIFAFREGEKLSQKKMADLLGISKQSICNLEKGRRIPTPSRAALIAEKLGMIPESFIELALQDNLRKESLYYKVSISKERKSKKIAS